MGIETQENRQHRGRDTGEQTTWGQRHRRALTTWG